MQEVNLTWANYMEHLKQNGLPIDVLPVYLFAPGALLFYPRLKLRAILY